MSVTDQAAGLRYADKVCIVTGGASGIGEGCVRTFVRHGSKVVFCGLGVDTGKSLENELNQAGPGTALYVQCDVTKEQNIKDMVNQVVTKYGRIDCLINNAGAHPPAQFIDDVTADMFLDLFNLNVLGYFLMSKHALPHIRKTSGCIINMSSLVAQIGQKGAVPYAATKGAVSAMTRAMAIDEAINNVRVNAVSPGNVWTPLWELNATETGDKNTAVKIGTESQLLGRFGTPREAGELCLYIAAEGTFLTGVDIPLSGGAELDYGKKIPLGHSKHNPTQT